jgi:hypothetical protein
VPPTLRGDVDPIQDRGVYPPPFAPVSHPNLLRSDNGHLFGVYGRNAQAALSAALLELKLIIDTFRGFDLCDTPEGTLFVHG